jgi:hypothetical protein
MDAAGLAGVGFRRFGREADGLAPARQNLPNPVSIDLIASASRPDPT